MLHANVMALCFIEPDLLPIEYCVAGIGIFDHFCKNLPGCQQMASVLNGIETLPKISIV